MVTSSAPIQSTWLSVSALLSGTRQTESTITAIASGTFRKKAQRQEAFSINHPPTTGPAAAVMDVKPDHVPIAPPRLLSGNEALMIDKLPGTRNAAPNPCTARAITNSLMFPARAQATEATANTVTPNRNIRLRPNTSPKAPPVRINALSNKRVGFDNPLYIGHGSAKAILNCGQRNVYNRAVNESHAGAEYRRGKNPRFGGFFAWSGCRAGFNCCGIAWRLHSRP